MSNYALVIDTNKQPLSPCHPSVARKLLDSGKAAVFRMYPFTIILNKSCLDVVNQAIELKIDPGSKTTGIALIQGEKIIFGGELSHRGNAIKASLESRRSLRRGRRNRQGMELVKCVGLTSLVFHLDMCRELNLLKVFRPVIL